MNASHRTPSTHNLEVKDSVLWCRGHHQAKPIGLLPLVGKAAKYWTMTTSLRAWEEAVRPLFPLLLLSHIVAIPLSLICSNPKNYLSTVHLLQGFNT